MATVGMTLATERARQGLDLGDVARVTKLSPRALQAIEADDFEQLPGVVFARSFVRQYAEALQLDPVAMARQFDREQSVPEPDYAKSEKPSGEFIPAFVSKPGRDRFGGSVGGDAASAFTTFVVTLAICGAAFWGFQHWRERRTATAGHAAQAAPKVVAAPVTPPAVKETQPASPAPTPVRQDAVAPVAPVALGTPSPSASSNVHVDLTAKSACWTRITADGKVVFAGILNAGDTRTINASSAVMIRAGNAAALALKLNGTDLKPLGPEGQIRSVTLTQAGAQVRTPSPELVSDF